MKLLNWKLLVPLFVVILSATIFFNLNITGNAVSSSYCCKYNNNYYIRDACTNGAVETSWSGCEIYTKCTNWCTSKGFNSGTYSGSVCSCSSSLPFCSDTDSGKDYTKKGTTSEAPGIGNGPYTDSCASSTSLKEYYCDTKNIARVETVPCASCVDGACVSSISKVTLGNKSSCVDADLGYPVYDVAGTVTNSSGTFTDFCTGNIIHEYGCQDKIVSSGYAISEIDCISEGKVCVKGACLSSYSSEDTPEHRVSRSGSFGTGINVKSTTIPPVRAAVGASSYSCCGSEEDYVISSTCLNTREWESGWCFDYSCSDWCKVIYFRLDLNEEGNYGKVNGTKCECMAA